MIRISGGAAPAMVSRSPTLNGGGYAAPANEPILAGDLAQIIKCLQEIKLNLEKITGSINIDYWEH